MVRSASSRVSNHEATREAAMIGTNPNRFILRDASLRDAPQDEVLE
jgi:hypothetical protein